MHKFFDALKEFGINTDNVYVFTDINEYKKYYIRFLTEYNVLKDEKYIETTLNSAVRAGEYVAIMPDGSVYVWMQENPDIHTLYHAVGHVLVDRKIGLRIRGRVYYVAQPTCKPAKNQVYRYILSIGDTISNILGDVLADLAIRNTLGEGYWRNAVKEMMKARTILAELTGRYMDMDIGLWMIHVIDAVYGNEATSKEKQAIENYTKNPSMDTAIELLDNFIDVGQKAFNLNLSREIKGSKPATYWVILFLVITCFNNVVFR